MLYRVSRESRSEARFATLLIAAGLVATLLIWRQSEWETLAAKSLLLIVCACAAFSVKAPTPRGAYQSYTAATALTLLPCLAVWQAQSTSAIPYLSFRSAIDWMTAGSQR